MESTITDFDGATDLLRAWSRGIRPDPDLTVSEWADGEWLKQLMAEQLIIVKSKRGFTKLEW